MIPNVTVFGRSLSFYMVMVLAGIFVAGFYALRQAKKKGLDEIDFLFTLLWSSVGVFFGGHLLYAVTNYEAFNTFLSSFGEIWARGDFLNYVLLLFGGSVFYGGLLGGLFAGRAYAEKKGLPVAGYSDIAASMIPLFHVFGRLGCFFSGCCYGVESSFGFVYRYSPVAEANGVCRFPVQLLEAGCNLLLFVVLYWLLRKGLQRGRLLYFYLIAYGCIRFADEFLRGDAYRGVWFGISTSQGIAAATILVSVILLLKNRPVQKKNT